MENTVEDFWRMIWEYEVFTIVMLSSAEESDSVRSPYYFLLYKKGILKMREAEFM